MNKALGEVPAAPNLTSKSDWIEVSPHVYQRPCVGQEHSASFNQNVADGHTELTIALNFSTSMSAEELVKRARAAWTSCRTLHPEIAVELSTDLSIPQLMTYRILPDGAAMQAWMDETFVVVEDRAFDDVQAMTYNRRLTTRGKQSMMYLVLDSRSGKAAESHDHCIIWNVSHAVTDAYSIVQFINTFLDETVKGAQAIDGAALAEIAQHLPISPLVPYQALYRPTESDKQRSLDEARAQLTLYKDRLAHSVAMYPEPDYAVRPHHTHCLATHFSLADSTAILDALQQVRVGITYVGAAATLLAAHQMYGKGHETGALLGMTRNARRWVATVLPATGRVAIPMATDVVFLWIPFATQQRQRQTRAERVVAVAREIKTQLSTHLVSPHYLASVPYMSDVVVDSLRGGLPAEAAPSSPGFSSQGVPPIAREVQAGSRRITRNGFSHTGRQVGPSPWIGMFTLDDCIRFSIGFDSKYYRPDAMDAFLTLVRDNVAAVADMPEQAASSKL